MFFCYLCLTHPCFSLSLIPSYEHSRGGGEVLPDFLFLLFSPVQQTLSGVRYHVERIFRVGDQYYNNSSP